MGGEMRNLYGFVRNERFATLFAETLSLKEKIKIRGVLFDPCCYAYLCKVQFSCGRTAEYYIGVQMFEDLLLQAKDTVPVRLTPGYIYVSKETIEKVGLDILKKINGGGEIIETKQETWRDRPPLL